MKSLTITFFSFLFVFFTIKYSYAQSPQRVIGTNVGLFASGRMVETSLYLQEDTIIRISNITIPTQQGRIIEKRDEVKFVNTDRKLSTETWRSHFYGEGVEGQSAFKYLKEQLGDSLLWCTPFSISSW